MASKRRPIHTNQNATRLNFRSNTTENLRSESRGGGTKPTSTPTSMKEIFTIMVLHICKKSIFFDTNIKIAFYLGTLFLVSLISDFAPIPKTYFSRSDNIFNQYFVKFAWGWNLILLVPFVALTSLNYCCGKIDTILRNHAPRIIIATAFWFFWTKMFNVIEATYGRCNAKGDAFNTKQTCLKGGFFWHGLDLSGHSFILIYGSLVLIEEARVIIGWEYIRDNLRNEEHYRNTKDKSVSTNPLRNLTDVELKFLKVFYEKFTPYIRGLFIIITLMQILWDVMLISTMLYYHIMIEKFLGGIIGILTWFFTYRVWYTIPNCLPKLPGEGAFKYNRDKPSPETIPITVRKRASFLSSPNGNQTPRFMGMPIYGSRNAFENTNEATSSAPQNEDIISGNTR